MQNLQGGSSPLFPASGGSGVCPWARWPPPSHLVSVSTLLPSVSSSGLRVASPLVSPLPCLIGLSLGLGAPHPGGPHLRPFTSAHLQGSYFRTRSYPEVLAVTMCVEDTTLPSKWCLGKSVSLTSGGCMGSPLPPAIWAPAEPSAHHSSDRAHSRPQQKEWKPPRKMTARAAAEKTSPAQAGRRREPAPPGARHKRRPQSSAGHAHQQPPWSPSAHWLPGPAAQALRGPRAQTVVTAAQGHAHQAAASLSPSAHGPRVPRPRLAPPGRG